MTPPFPVAEYVARFPKSLDARRFLAMRDAGAVEELVDRNGIKRLTAAGGWRKRWNHWGDRSCLTTGVPYTNTDMPYVRCEEKGVYLRKLCELIDDLDLSDQNEDVHRDFCCLYWPYDELWFTVRHDYWWRDLDFEHRQRQRLQCPIFARWHNTELLAIPAAERVLDYVSVPA